MLSSFPTPTADSLGWPDSDAAWMSETAADLSNPTQMDLQFSDIWSTDIGNLNVPDLHTVLSEDNHVLTDTHIDLVASQDSPAGVGTPHGSSLFAPESQPTQASAGWFQWPPSSSAQSPHFSAANQAISRTTQLRADLCTSQRRASETCLTTALRTLTDLHIAHATCLSTHSEGPTAQQTRKMETVLSTNRDAVACMGTILACSCSTKSTVQLLLLSICGNLMAWNSAMINADLGQGDDPFSPISALSANPAQALEARVLPQPITIGQHTISGKLGQILHTQVMAGELRILEGLVDALSRRLCEASPTDGAFNTSPTAGHMRNINNRTLDARDAPSLHSRGLASSIHRQVISSLRTRLEIARARIFSQG